MAQQQAAQQNPSAVGIDLGSFQSVVAVTRRTGVEVLTNQANFRQTPNVVGYGDCERYLGEAGSTRIKTNFNNTVTFITRFLGLSAECSLTQVEKKFVTVRTVNTPSGRLAFGVTYRSKETVLLSEQVVAAFLHKLQLIMEIHRIDRLEPVVLSVPAYYNVFERRALLDAAAIGGMKVSRLINESTAVAIDYALNRRSEFLQNSPKYVLFVDFGHSKLSLTTISFTREKVAVVCQHNQRNLGCRDMDYLVLQFYREVFRKQSNGLDVMQNKKAFVKLLEAIEKQRKVLSANSQNGLHMEYLSEEEDLNYNMRREEFEQIIEPVLQKITQAVQKHKADLQALGLKQLWRIELVGGGTRVPSVLRILQSLFGMEVSRTINSSQAIAKGCAYMSAFKNPLFRPADFAIEDANYNPIIANWRQGPELLKADLSDLKAMNSANFPAQNRNTLFPAGCALPAVRQLRFRTNDPIQVLLTYQTTVADFPTNLASILSTMHKLDQQKSLVMNFLLDENGLVSLQDCFVEPDIPKPAPPNQLMRVKPAMQLYHTNLTTEEITQLHSLETSMQLSDRSTEQTYEYKNKLEAYIYSTKEKLITVYKDYISPEEHTHMTGQLDEINQWLYDSDPHTVQTNISVKSKEITAVLEPINIRIRDQQEYHKVVHESKQDIEGFTKAIQAHGKGTLPPKERDWALAEVTKIHQYLHTAEEEYKKAVKYRPPNPSINDINRIMMSLKQKVDSVLESSQPQKPSGGIFGKVFDKFRSL